MARKKNQTVLDADDLKGQTTLDLDAEAKLQKKRESNRLRQRKYYERHLKKEPVTYTDDQKRLLAEHLQGKYIAGEYRKRIVIPLTPSNKEFLDEMSEGSRSGMIKVVNAIIEDYRTNHSTENADNEAIMRIIIEKYDKKVEF